MQIPFRQTTSRRLRGRGRRRGGASSWALTPSPRRPKMVFTPLARRLCRRKFPRETGAAGAARDDNRSELLGFANDPPPGKAEETGRVEKRLARAASRKRATEFRCGGPYTGTP